MARTVDESGTGGYVTQSSDSVMNNSNRKPRVDGAILSIKHFLTRLDFGGRALTRLVPESAPCRLLQLLKKSDPDYHLS
jgi:hypothetical protein